MRPDNLGARQIISMEPESRQRLRATALTYEIGHGPFARVLIAAGLDLLEQDQAFRDRIAEDIEAEKSRYRRS
ncbi:hypothetical protein [Nesterenkonia aerolata]|uniref:Uncharacterized protein n=1 Tax=Nesterenkonia aerolata TaxID=3074079 RepID=A0ABU2DS31_9MICC|nr:hypothetical protein [Nesterenkonia sp. LY-0111]MDR8019221.1 hypothetical protein [Nesterenkonia sp. LY-0111]